MGNKEIALEGNQEAQSAEESFNVLVEKFVSSPRFKHYNPRTQSAYNREYERFGIYLKEAGVVSLDQLSQSDINKYFDNQRQEFSLGTMRAMACILRAIFKSAPGAIDASIKISPLKTETRLGGFQHLSTDQIIALYDAASKSKRDSALLAVAFATGASPPEIVELNIPDVTQIDNTGVQVHFGGKKSRTLMLPPYESTLVWEYVESQESNEGPLFRNLYHSNNRSGYSRLRKNIFFDKLRQYGGKINLPELNSRMVRQTFIVQYQNSDDSRTGI